MTAATPLVRKLDIRAEITECRMELAEHKRSELTFIRRFKDDAARVVRLIEGGLLVEAEFTAGGMLHLAGRREVQLLAPDDDEAA